MLQVGDRVVRPLTIGGETMRHGVIHEVYLSMGSSNVGASPPLRLYAVVWDGTSVPERGYLEVSLHRERVA